MQNPFHFNGPTPPEHFLGRHALVVEIIEGLYEWEGDSYGIVGGRRFGKSSLLLALKDSLLKRVTQVEIGDLIVWPISLSLKAAQMESPADALGYLVHQLKRNICGSRKALPHQHVPLLELDLLEYTQMNPSPASLQELEAALETIVVAAGETLGMVRIAFLIDEIDAVLAFPWAGIFFGHLRSLIYDGEMKDYVRLILAGSGRYIDVDEQGSPLSNAITGIYLEPFSEEAAYTLINLAVGVSPDVADEVIRQSGCHPFLMQYLLHYLFEQKIQEATREQVHDVVRRFWFERSADLDGWWQGLGEDGQQVYSLVRFLHDWFTIAEVIHLANNLDLQVDRGFRVLCHHGLTLHDGTYRTYRVSGQLFQDWAETRCQALTKDKFGVSHKTKPVEYSTPKQKSTNMEEKAMAPVEVFYSSSDSPKDIPLLHELEHHLSILQQDGLLTTWHKRQTLPGKAWQEEIDRHLDTASLILLLISSDFLASNLCVRDMQRALQQRAVGKAQVIPVLLRACVWDKAPFAALTVLPTGARPIIQWSDRDAAWTDVVIGIRRVLDQRAKEGKQEPSVVKCQEGTGMQTIKALFLAANPASTNRLAIDEEMRAIEQKVRSSEHRDVLVFQSNWAVRPDDLLQLLNQHRPQIVHFSGHGSQTGLYLAGNDGQVKSVTARALAVLFATLKDNIRLVFLNACYSREQAQALVTTIDCVVGMKASIHDEAATIFASSFYRAIGFGRSIQEAFDQGRTALLLEGIPEENIPELLVKDGIDPTQIVLIRQQANPS